MIDEYFNDAYEYMYYDGHYVALPWNFSLRFLIANTDLLEEAGVEMPTTWEEFHDACAAVVEKTDAYGTILSGDTQGKQTVTVFLQNNDGGYFTKDRGNNVLSENNIEAVTFLTNLGNEGLLHPAGPGMTNQEHEKFLKR